jgi:hypothetical protein
LVPSTTKERKKEKERKKGREGGRKRGKKGRYSFPFYVIWKCFFN